MNSDEMEIRMTSSAKKQKTVENPEEIFTPENEFENPIVSISKKLSIGTPFFSTGGPICRICHDGKGKNGALLSLCRCSGTLGLIHKKCLERWLSMSSSNKCEICNFKYCVVSEPGSFCRWVLKTERPEDWRNLIGDFICFLLLTPLAAISAFLCISGAQNYSVTQSRWEVIGLIVLAMGLISVYFTWVSVTFKYHSRIYNDWSLTHQRVRIVKPGHPANRELSPIELQCLDSERSSNNQSLVDISPSDSFIFSRNESFYSSLSLDANRWMDEIDEAFI